MWINDRGVVMSQVKADDNLLIEDLGGGLILRRSSPTDARALSDFNAKIHSDDGPDQPDERLAAWTSDLLEVPHPTFDPGDFTIVEDTSSGQIVSSSNLISQTWSYAGIEFGVGRPELVGTHKDYRRRGLIRAQFDVLHQWSAGRGHQLQAITGIPNFYRQFGYEMAIDLGGGRYGYSPQIPKLKKDEGEPYSIRPAKEADILFIDDLFKQAAKRYLVNCLWDEVLWRYELNGKSENNIQRSDIRIIEKEDGERVGFFAHSTGNWANGAKLPAYRYEIKPGLSWAEVTPSVVRYLQSIGVSRAEKLEKEPFGAFGFWLGSQHPVYEVMRDGLPNVRKPYAWYIRVPDLPGFLEHITPVLEGRLAESPYDGHTGELKITFYCNGLKLSFDRGKLQVETWEPTPYGHSGDVAFPDLTFTQLLFGYRSLEELDYAFADCWCGNDTARGLMNTIFPKQPSSIWPIA
jgi:GNAT superfamily N-acetyltransferase